jgi:hypothetical protein
VLASLERVNAMTTDNRPWWSLSREEQKQQIEEALESYLAQESELTDRQMMLIRDAIGHAHRGLFGLAAQDVICLDLPEDQGPPVDPSTLGGVNRSRSGHSTIHCRNGRKFPWPVSSANWRRSWPPTLSATRDGTIDR